MTKFVFLIAGVISFCAAPPAEASEVLGTWLIQDGTAKVRIYPCGEAICGNVVWLSQPLDQKTGLPQTDKLNVDAEKRSRAMLGVPVVLGMQRQGEENRWHGRIYNPDDGNTYRGTIEILDRVRLKVEGCVSVFCQSEIWTRSN